MKRRQFLKWAAISGAASTAFQFRPLLSAESRTGGDTTPASAKTPIQGDNLRFVVFGDWGSGNTVQKNVARAMSQHCVAAKQAGKSVDFAISVGDNFYNDGVKNPADAQWDTKFEAMYPAASMPFPFYATLGNHDWHLDPNAQLLYGAKPGTRWNMDGFYYSRSIGGTPEAPLADFFFFDTDLWLPQYNAKGLGDKQMVWLERALTDSKAHWKILVGHHPPYSDGEHAGDKDLTIIQGLLPALCEKYSVDVLLSGHDHDMQRIEVPTSKTQFIVCGAGGAGLRPRKTHDYGPFYRDMTGGFLSVELGRDSLRGQFHDVEGALLHEWQQAPRGV